MSDVVNIDDSFAKPRCHMDAMYAGDTQSPEVVFFCGIISPVLKIVKFHCLKGFLSLLSR